MKCLLFSGALVGVVSLASLFGLYYASKVYDHPLDFRPLQPVAHRDTVVNETHPPLYEDLDFQELSLPQHDASLPYPEGGGGTYFFPANRLWGVDFSDAFQEHLLLAYIAYKANRSFVFTPFTLGSNLSEPYSIKGGNTVPSRIPWHAFVEGPAFGDAFPPGDQAPRAVRREYWDTVCRWPKTIKASSFSFGLWNPKNQNIADVTNDWVKNWTDFQADAAKSYWFRAFTRQGVTEVYEDFIRSPIITQLRWSPLVESAIQQNLRTFLPFVSPLSPSSSNTLQSYKGLLVVHLRMGDFDVQCYKFHKESTQARGWSELPDIPDKFDPPAEEEWEARHDYYYKSCSPSFYQIINKLKAIRESDQGRGIRSLYLMSDGTLDYLKNLAIVLVEDAGWEFVSTSRDMVYDPEQLFVSQAVELAIAQRAELFLGNGVRTLFPTAYVQDVTS
ncbi:hypothetical protein SCHPADRAFT_934713 [Schizopora paradoxa]|uniref:O-fucosyltransferase family protein n=1 Tax=Schizopora paradoxa TaxID=27342 RepID=A0A0H2SEE5_9AGAM|nr:hypothetical protein SCHPADRAFT_934713 [Schizopora paradoxa]